MKKIFITIFALVLLVMGFQVVAGRFYSMAGNKIIPLEIKDKIFYAEVVSTNEKMQKGLGGRKGLCERCGMLFVFSESGRYAFWMKDMKFPLDILWISKNKIVHIEKNIKPDMIGSFSSNEDADIVLELRSGTSDSLDIKVGDELLFR